MAVRKDFPTKSDKNKMSFAKSFAAWKYLIPFFKMVWDTSKTLTLVNLLSRLLKAGLPLAML
ncbi:MAG: hypothetical protein AAGK97_13185, partial [Bacteroidota bacterium]